jgi:hypothetical protein
VTRHPCPFSDEVLDLIAEWLPVERYPLVLDPFAGTGRIHELPNFTVGVEREPEWAAMAPGTVVATALVLPLAARSFDAIATSPCFGNRLADHHEARDGSVRHSYRHDLGRPLSPGSAGELQWGAVYREFHRQAWAEAVKALDECGRFVLHCKDHIRGGERQRVSAFHVEVLTDLGLSVVAHTEVPARGLRFGANAERRVATEDLVVLDKC